MTLRILEDASKFSEDMTSGVVVLTSDLEGHRVFDELQGIKARHMALGFAVSKGIADARINGTPTGAYPVNADGRSLDTIKGEDGNSLPAQHPEMQVKSHQIDVPVVRNLL